MLIEIFVFFLDNKFMSDASIKKLEEELRKKVGEDKITEGLPIGKSKFRPLIFSKLAKELRNVFEDREKSGTNPALRYR